MNTKPSRAMLITFVLVALLLSGITRHWAGLRRGEQHLAASTPLSRMNSYALALLLGGLRGPLVMFLWPSSEGQKSQKNLEDFDTKVEWIRLLQAEFDTVHLFQIWNKAYNISVLMANLPNKYATILDALDYAHEVDSERPGNLNILSAIASIYGDKLGGSSEKEYYKARVRSETQARRPTMRVTLPAEERDAFIELASRAGVNVAAVQFVASADGKSLLVTIPKSIAETIRPQFSGEGISWVGKTPETAGRKAAGFRRVELDPMLDEQGKLLPQLVAPRPQHAVGSNDGSDLQYLRQFGPFPFGLSAHALAYNYHKRSQVLFRENNQHHAQLSDLVVDSRPGVSLRDWSEDAWEVALRAELAAFGKEIPKQPEMVEARIRMAPVTMNLPLQSEIINKAALNEAISEYEISSRASAEANLEYDEHLKHFSTNFQVYRSHQDLLWAHAALTRGDAAFLRLVRGDADRAELEKKTTEAYSEAIRRFHLLLLNYYANDPQSATFFPQGVTPDNIAQKLSAQEIAQLIERLAADVRKLGSDRAQYYDEFAEYFTYIRRAEARLAQLRKASSETRPSG